MKEECPPIALNGTEAYGRFGSALLYPGDINNDKADGKMIIILYLIVYIIL